MPSVHSVSLLVTLVGNLLSFSAHIGDLCSVFCLNEEVGKYSIVSRNNCCFSVCDNGRASVSGLWKMLSVVPLMSACKIYIPMSQASEYHIAGNFLEVQFSWFSRMPNCEN